jgi:hypothetical protein
LNVSLASLRIENEKLITKAKELDVCNASIFDLRNNNDILRAKIVELNSCKPSTSTIEHVTICTRCRDVNINVIHDHMALIKQQNDHIAKLDAKIAEHDLENENFKFARSMPVIPRAKLGEFILGSLTLALIMILCIRVRHLALGNQPVLNCLRRKLLSHQMILTFHLKLLMLLMF